MSYLLDIPYDTTPKINRSISMDFNSIVNLATGRLGQAPVSMNLSLKPILPLANTLLTTTTDPMTRMVIMQILEIVSNPLGVGIGGTGNDRLHNHGTLAIAAGGDGNDQIRTQGQAIGIATGGNGDDMVVAQGAVGLGLSFGGDGRDMVGSERSILGIAFGGEGDDVAIANGNLFGLSFGGNGNDRVSAGDNIIFGAAYGEAGDDHVTGGRGTLFSIADGGNGDDTVRGGSNIILSEARGGEGNDNVRGGSGWFTKTSGGEGDDLVTAGQGKSNSASGDNGNDMVQSNENRGKAVNIQLDGGNGDDVMQMHGIHNETVHAGNDNDVILADRGYASGGVGIDTAIFNGNASDYNIVKTDENQYELTHTASGAITTLEDVEMVQFSNDMSQYTLLQNDEINVDNTQNRKVSAGAGEDLIHVSAGTENQHRVIDGGDDNDTVVLEGSRKDYQVTYDKESGMATVINQSTGAQTELHNVEMLRFSDSIGEVQLLSDLSQTYQLDTGRLFVQNIQSNYTQDDITQADIDVTSERNTQRNGHDSESTLRGAWIEKVFDSRLTQSAEAGQFS